MIYQEKDPADYVEADFIKDARSALQQAPNIDQALALLKRAGRHLADGETRYALELEEARKRRQRRIL